MPNKPIPTKYADLLKLDQGKWARATWVISLIALVVIVPIMMSTGALSPRWVGVALESQIFIVGAVGLMLLTGVAGQLSLGHAALLAVGGFSAASLALHFGLPWWITLLLSGALAALLGVAIAPFALRLEGLYLAIVTLGLVFIVQHILNRWEYVSGGSRGTAVPMWNWFVNDAESLTSPERAELSFGSSPITVGALTFGKEIQLYLLFLVITLAVVAFARNLLRSRMGRAMSAIGASDLAAGVLGIHVGKVKTLAFAVSSFMAGIAGAMWGWKQTFLTVDPPFNLQLSMEFVAMIFIGGLGTIFGAVAGAVLFAVGKPLISELSKIPFIKDSPLQEGDVTLLVFGVIVIIFMALEPKGLRGIWMKIKRYFTTWPVG